MTIPGMLSLDELRSRVEQAQIDTVLLAFTDIYGRQFGKRLDARFFLESVVYHEMLHHHMGGVPDRAGRTVYHTRSFREAEARFPRHHEALDWEKDHLPELLRASHAIDRERRAARIAAQAGATAARDSARSRKR